MTTLDAHVLERTLQPDLGRGRVEQLRRLSGGASRESWSFDFVVPDGARQGYVLRRDPSGHAGESDRETESALLIAARAGGLPVPRVRARLSGDAPIGSGFVMDRVEGETIPRRILRDAACAPALPHLAEQCGTIAAGIHGIDVATLPPIAVRSARTQIDEQRALLDAFGEPHPAFELAVRSLEGRIPDGPPAPQLVHGDFRNGNFVVGPEGIRAVLDWELAHLGDPIEDLGWLCVKSWRFGVDDKIVGGFGDIPDLLDAYRASGGSPVDDDTLRFWITLGTIKWGVMCVGQAFTHLDGIVRSIELATIGRRVAEMEWDVLGLLEGGV